MGQSARSNSSPAQQLPPLAPLGKHSAPLNSAYSLEGGKSVLFKEAAVSFLDPEGQPLQQQLQAEAAVSACGTSNGAYMSASSTSNGAHMSASSTNNGGYMSACSTNNGANMSGHQPVSSTGGSSTSSSLDFGSSSGAGSRPEAMR